ncbi:MAG: tetratricopeptide repeat protein, partial [Crocinitomix sp.]|nr:tetratricopeptide repeat protein [Crocinitomix sp.]
TVNLENEYQLIPEEIDTLEFIEKTEIITISEVKKKQDLQLTKPVNGEPELIAIEDDETDQDEFRIEKEQISWRRPGQETPTTLYYFDLMVVDYRTIKRTNNNIHYTRHELTGIAADQENGSVERKDLIETEVEIPYMSYLNKTMEYFSKSNFKQALTRFLIIIEQYPADANALFYGGLSYFNLGQYEEAINFFNKVLASNLYIFQEESLWYKTKALLKLNKKAEANLLLDELIIRDGFYVQDAIQLKKQIQR